MSPDDCKEEFRTLAGLEVGDTIFFMADKEERAAYYAGMIRNELGEKLDLIEKNAYRFCYVNDFPMFEKDPETKKIGFTHNPFSMPQGGLEALNTMDPLDILAYQYDIVCNGVEFSSLRKSMIIRSTPGAIPACGGAPYWNAVYNAPNLFFNTSLS